MGFGSRMQHDVVIVKPGVTVSRAGDTRYTWENPASRTDVRAWVETRSASEDESLRDRSELEVRFFFLPIVVISNEDRLEWAGRTFSVVGPPQAKYSSRGLHHYEVEAVEFNG